jgi:hypothetical protein
MCLYLLIRGWLFKYNMEKDLINCHLIMALKKLKKEFNSLSKYLKSYKIMKARV